MVKIESKIACPLSLTMLNKMETFVNFDHPIQVVAWAVILVGFHLLLHKSNLAPNSTLEFKSACQLHCGMVLVNIKWSKTRWIGNRVTMQLLRSKGPTCPVSTLKKLFLFIKASPSDPQFTFHHSKAYSQLRLSILTYLSLG